MKYIKDHDDLIVLYDTFYLNKGIIITEIDKYLNIKNKIKKKNHWMSKIFYYIENEIREYVLTIEDNSGDKYKRLLIENIDKIYKKHDIYKYIINFYLRCNDCNNYYKLKKDKQFYDCLNCDLIYCEDCCINCNKCDNMKVIYKHCFYCKDYKCLESITNKIKNLKINESSKIDYYSKLTELKAKYCLNKTEIIYKTQYPDIDEDKIDEIYDVLINENNNELSEEE